MENNNSNLNTENSVREAGLSREARGLDRPKSGANAPRDGLGIESHERKDELGSSAQSKDSESGGRKPTKATSLAKAADSLSLGISIVVAVLIGFGLGYGMKYLTGSNWALGVGIFIGVAAAINNVYKAYREQQRSYDELGASVKPRLKDEDEV